jgi:uncharacterized cupredoxin-like copper-binding protein
MCGWDGTVRVLGYGVSSVGKFAAQMPNVCDILNYMSPEQIRGQNLDARSNLFSLGAMLYEMTTDHKAFDGEDAETTRESILASVPAPPLELNPKLHPLLSELIMKTLAKDPGERYQSAKELLDDLELCKESKPLAAKTPVAAAKVTAPPAIQAPVPNPARPASPAVTPATSTATAAAAKPAPVAPARVAPASALPSAARKLPVASPPAARKIPAPIVPGKVTASAVARTAAQPAASVAKAAAPKTSMPNAGRVQPSTASVPGAVRPGAAARVKPTAAPGAQPSPSMSAADVGEAEIDAPPAAAPKIAVDPLMAETAPAADAVSFSEMTELPPLKEDLVPASKMYAAIGQSPALSSSATASEAETPKMQAQEVAAKALNEIKNVPPRLMVYSIAGAAVIILIIAIALVLHVNNLNNEGESPRPSAAATPAPAAPAQTAVPSSNSAQRQAAQTADAESAADTEAAAPARVSTTLPKGKRGTKKSAVPVAPAIVPGQMAIDSTPQGAQVQIDGKSDASWVTPFTLPGLTPGSHSIMVSKSGYVSDTRVVEVTSGGKSFVVTHLTQLMATLSVSSTPAGASVYVDGKDIGKLTPAQVTVEKGQHVVLVRKQGFLDETTNAQFALGQTFSFAPALRPLGNVDDIKTVGKMNKLFGRKEAQNMGTVSIKTQPKGAQVAINQHMIEKSSPVDVQVDPGNYVVDITLNGYAPIHKVISVDKGAKAMIDEVMQHE